MKRVKIMLMSICLVAVAGGVLAFKARNIQRFCVTATINGGECPNLCPNIANIITAAAGANIVCTAPPVVVGPNGQRSCTFLQGGVTQTVTCDGTVRFTNTEL
jgi:hypothetical protein